MFKYNSETKILTVNKLYYKRTVYYSHTIHNHTRSENLSFYKITTIKYYDGYLITG